MSSTQSHEVEQTYSLGHVFEAVDYDRYIKCRGTLITVYDPEAPKGSEPYWRYKNSAVNETHLVPAGHEVEVLDAWVGWTTSA
jgi:hypothetical protein